jgi:4-amino-4-deoxy-L-arabinose transferase-like glycosyltransferase
MLSKRLALNEIRLPVKPILALSAIVAFHAVNNLLWLARDNRIWAWDPTKHYLFSLDYWDLTQQLNSNIIPEALSIDRYYPPLGHLMPLSMYVISGNPSYDAGAMINLLYIAVLVFATWGIVRKLTNSDWAGVLGAFMVSMFPGIFAYSRLVMLDIPLATTVALAVLLLIQTDRFDKKGSSLLLGICLGLGMLIKWTFPVFLIGPIIYVFWTSRARETIIKWRPSSEIWRALRLNTTTITLAVVVGLVITLAWYWPSRTSIEELALGEALFPLSVVLIGLTTFCLTRRSGPAMNFISSMALGGLVASIWYLPRADFVRQFASVAYGSGGYLLNATSLL